MKIGKFDFSWTAFLYGLLSAALGALSTSCTMNHAADILAML